MYYQHALALSPMLVGMGLHVVCYAQYHGRYSMRWANTFQLLNIGLIPLSMMLWTTSIPAAFVWTGLAMSLVSAAGISAQFRNAKKSIQGVFPAIRALLRFGPPRVPGDIALAALMVLPATIVTHSCDVRRGGLVAFSITLLTLAQTTTTPISTLLLPQATTMLRCGKVAELRSRVIRLLMASSAMTALGVVFFWVATDFSLRICLGQYAAELPSVAQIIMIGALPLNCYTCLRSIVDAGRDRAVNARSICASLACFFLAWPLVKYASDDLHAAPMALVVALFCLAGMTSWEVWQILRPSSAWARPYTQPLQRDAA